MKPNPRSSLFFLIALSMLLAGPVTAQSMGDSTSSGGSRAFNPAISLNGLFLGHYVDGSETHELTLPTADHDHEHGEMPEGLLVQEMELRFTADIDPYSKADATIAYHDGNFGLEEIFVDSHALPGGIGLRAGRFYVPLSRENTTHTHQLAFATRSVGQEEMFGEGWADAGVQLAWLTPLPWYVEVRGAVFDGDQESWFSAEDGEQLAFHAGATTLVELSEATTVEFDIAAVAGENGMGDNSSTSIVGLGTRLRWKPTRGPANRSVRFAAEFIAADREGDLDIDGDSLAATQSGFASFLQVQFARRWWTSIGYDQFNPHGGGVRSRVRGSVAFVPSEFQVLRLELAQTDAEDAEEQTDTEVFLQYNFTIGSHPAHRY